MSIQGDTIRVHRPLSAAEATILHRMLAAEFPGHAALLAQLRWTWVSGICPCGCPSIVLTVDRSKVAPAAVGTGMVVDGACRDHDGMPIEVLVHVLHGYLRELEVLRVDSAPVALPDPGTVEVFLRPGLGK